jgi:hypothetical protein
MTARKISKAAAEKLWTDIRTDLANAEKNIIKAIKTRAWEPLGYGSFVECWNDRLQGIRLATDVLKVHVVYALFETTDDPMSVAKSIGIRSGVTPETVQRIKRHRDHGMTVEEAVAAGIRKPWGVSSNDPQSKPVVIRGLDPEVFEAYRKLAGELGSTVEKEAAEALHAHFRKLAQRVARKQVAA